MPPRSSIYAIGPPGRASRDPDIFRKPDTSLRLGSSDCEGVDGALSTPDFASIANHPYLVRILYRLLTPPDGRLECVIHILRRVALGI
jgi:hypothetical protein